MVDQPNNAESTPNETSKLFRWPHMDPFDAVLLRVEAANWLWWLHITRSAQRLT